MPYLIDGNNLIGAMRVIDIRDPAAREKLTRLLVDYQKGKRDTVVAVYDGPPPPGVRPVTHIGRLTAIYAGPETDADTRIRRILEGSSDPASYTVVSSDRQVYHFARWVGAGASRVMAFYSDLKATVEEAGLRVADFAEPSREEAEEWMRDAGAGADGEGNASPPRDPEGGGGEPFDRRRPPR